MNYDLIYSAALNLISRKLKKSSQSVIPGDMVSVIVSRSGNLYHGESRRTANQSVIMQCAESAALKMMISNNESEIEAMVVVDIMTKKPVYPCEKCRIQAIALSTANAGTFVMKPDKSFIKLCEIEEYYLSCNNSESGCFVEEKDREIDDDVVSAVCANSNSSFISTSFVQCSQFGNIGCITTSEYRNNPAQVPVGNEYADVPENYNGSFQKNGPNEEYRSYAKDNRKLYYNDSLNNSGSLNRRQFSSDGFAMMRKDFSSSVSDVSKKVVISENELQESNAASDIYKNNVKKFITGETPAVVKNDKPDMEHFYKKKFDSILNRTHEKKKF